MKSIQHAITQMNLENMLSERNETQKAQVLSYFISVKYPKQTIYGDTKQTSGFQEIVGGRKGE